MSNEEFQARLRDRRVLAQLHCEYVGGFTHAWIRVPAGRVNVAVTDRTVYVDHFIKRRLIAFHPQKPGRHALFEFPTADIEDVLIQPFETALAGGVAGVAVPIGGSGMSVGGLGGSVKQEQWSGVSFVLRDGQRVLFKSFGPPVTVETHLAALLQFVHDQAVVPTGSESGDRYQQLRELAALRDEGILTEDEFVREKARLLDDDSAS